MTEDISNDINDSNNEYVVITKNINDILNELNFKDEERLLCESIITNIEKTAAEAIKNNKVVQLPSIGCIRKSPLQQAMKKNAVNFRIARKHLTKDEYKDHVRSVINYAKEEVLIKDRNKLAIKRIMSNNKKRYDMLFAKLGKTYANMFVFSIFCLKEIPFDIEFEEHYKSLNY